MRVCTPFGEVLASSITAPVNLITWMLTTLLRQRPMKLRRQSQTSCAWAATISDMISIGQCRRTATLWLMAFVVLWGQIGAAAVCSLSQHGGACSVHAHMKAMPAPADAVAAGCCPAHSVATSQCPSHPVRSIAKSDDQDCCVLSKQPARPFALLLTDGASHSFQAATAAAAATLPSLVRPLNSSRAPSFVKPVLDLKTDLRI